MRIRWTVPAADDLQDIKNYLHGTIPILQSRPSGQSISVSVP